MFFWFNLKTGLSSAACGGVVHSKPKWG